MFGEQWSAEETRSKHRTSAEVQTVAQCGEVRSLSLSRKSGASDNVGMQESQAVRQPLLNAAERSPNIGCLPRGEASIERSAEKAVGIKQSTKNYRL